MDEDVDIVVAPLDFEAPWELHEVRSAILYARLRLMPMRELLDVACDVTAEQHHSAQKVLRERESELTPSDAHFALALIIGATQESARYGLSATEKGRTDRLIANIGRVLPGNIAVPLALEHLTSSWAARRKSGLKLLRLSQLDASAGPALVHSARHYGDKDALHLASKVPHAFKDTSCCEIFEWPTQSLDTYGQAVILARLLAETLTTCDHAAIEHPLPFMQAIGRLPRLGLEPTESHIDWALTVVDSTHDIDVLCMASSVGGRMRCHGLIERVASRYRELLRLAPPIGRT